MEITFNVMAMAFIAAMSFGPFIFLAIKELRERRIARASVDNKEGRAAASLKDGD
jgi:hypothetical protein